MFVLVSSRSGNKPNDRTLIMSKQFYYYFFFLRGGGLPNSSNDIKSFQTKIILQKDHKFYYKGHYTPCKKRREIISHKIKLFHFRFLTNGYLYLVSSKFGNGLPFLKMQSRWSYVSEWSNILQIIQIPFHKHLIELILLHFVSSLRQFI